MQSPLQQAGMLRASLGPKMNRTLSILGIKPSRSSLRYQREHIFVKIRVVPRIYQLFASSELSLLGVYFYEEEVKEWIKKTC